MTQEYTVSVWGKPHVISIYRKTKTVWIAAGDYMGEPIQVENRSASSAAKLWAETARYRGN